MSRHTTWLLAFAAAIAIAASCNLDGPEDFISHQTDWGQSEELKALQASEARTTRRNTAAQALCAKERGPNSAARWLDDGSLACTARRGVVTAQNAKVQP